MAVRHNLRIEPYADFLFSARWRDKNKVPYPLSSARFQVRESVDATDPVIDASTDNSQIVIDGDDWARVRIPASDTAELQADLTPYVYDMLVTRTSDGVVKRLCEGQVIIAPGVTR